MSKKKILFGAAGLFALAVLLLQIPAIHERLAWRYEVTTTYIQNVLHPVGAAPTAIIDPVTPTIAIARSDTPTQTPTAEAVTTPTPTDVPLPSQTLLTSTYYEKQDMNNCGPATLSMALHMFGWNGNQRDISDVIKPVPADRNVNPDELAYWVRNNAGWLRIEYRVNGNINTIKKLIAAAYPVIIEGTTSLNPDDTGWPDDDLWAAHYLLVTGYDDAAQTFTVQDSYHGANQKVSYQQLESEWKPFNYMYMIVYLPQQEDEIKSLLGSDWDVELNRQNALTASQAATVKNPNDAFAWFNYGSNLVYFDKNDEANAAYDKARQIGLPQRMFRYQFGPFIADFQSNRIDDLLSLSNYALQRTEKSEEAWLWHGWALYRQGDTKGAIANWRKALEYHPGYGDALYALQFVGAQP